MWETLFTLEVAHQSERLIDISVSALTSIRDEQQRRDAS